MLLQSRAERAEIVETVAAAIGGRAQLIVQIGGLSLRDALENGRVAVQCGADALSAIPPVYYRYRTEEIYDYYRKIVEAFDLPFFLYNIPCCTGIDLMEEEYRKLFELPRVIGVKESTPHHDGMRALLREYPEAVLLNGCDEHLLTTLKLGVRGAVGSTYNLLPAAYCALCTAYGAGNEAEASALQMRCNAVLEVLIKYGNVPAVKHVLREFVGIDAGECRQPFRRLSDGEKQALTAEIAPLLSGLIS